MAVVAAFVFSPLLTLPEAPNCWSNGDPIVSPICQRQLQTYRTLLSDGASAFWSNQEVAVASLAGLALVSSLVTALRRRYLPLLVFLSGAWFFGSLVVVDVIQEPNYLANPLHDWARQVGNMPNFGIFAFASMLLAVAGLTAYRRKEGLFSSLKAAVLLFAAPSVVLLEIGLLVVSPTSMATHVTNFAPSFLTNWVVLAVASLLTLWGIAKPLIAAVTRRTRATR